MANFINNNIIDDDNAPVFPQLSAVHVAPVASLLVTLATLPTRSFVPAAFVAPALFTGPGFPRAPPDLQLPPPCRLSALGLLVPLPTRP